MRRWLTHQFGDKLLIKWDLLMIALRHEREDDLLTRELDAEWFEIHEWKKGRRRNKPESPAAAECEIARYRYEAVLLRIKLAREHCQDWDAYDHEGYGEKRELAAADQLLDLLVREMWLRDEAVSFRLPITKLHEKYDLCSVL